MTEDNVSRPTLDDVARVAGVSRQTAWKAVSGRGNVRPDNLRKVLEAAQQLGYQAVRRGPPVGNTRAHSVPVLVCDLGRPFESELAVGIQRAFSGSPLVPVFMELGERSETMQSAVRQILIDLPTLAAAIVMLPPGSSALQQLALLHNAGVKVLAVDRAIAEIPIPAVHVDNHAAAHGAVKHLVGDHGCRRVVYVGDDRSIPTFRDRRKGYETALELWHKSTEPTIAINASFDGASRGDLGDFPDLRELCESIAATNDGTGVFCANVSSAMLFIRMCRFTGVAIGSNARLVVFDDSPWWELLEPRVSAISQKPQLMGRRAAEVILEWVQSGIAPSEHIVMETEFVRRESCGCPIPS